MKYGHKTLKENGVAKIAVLVKPVMERVDEKGIDKDFERMART